MNRIFFIYKQGLIDGYKDYLKEKKNKKFIKIKIKKILPYIYNIGYIEGYTKFIEK